MITKDTIDQFMKDVEELNLKFPVAAISQATGISKGNVSKYLSGKLEPGETFLNLFYEKVYKSGRKVVKDLGSATNVHTETLIKTLQDHNKTLQENNDTLKEITLKQIGEHQKCLDDLGKSIKENQVLLVSLLSSQTVKADVIMEALDEIRGKRKGSLGEESHKRERRFQDEVKSRGRKDVSGNEGKN